MRFHLDRLRLLADYYPLVFDASHWWLNVLDRFFAEFPEGKAVGLVRETEACVRSFLNFQRRETKPINSWALPDNEIWSANLWDPTYPSYPLSIERLPEEPLDAEAIKAAMIRRYVTEYNQTLRDLAEGNPEQFLVIRTEEINESATITRLSDLTGFPLSMPAAALNVGTATDGQFSYKV